MRKIESIITYDDFGQVKIDIKNIMDQQKITRTQLVKNTGLHHKIIDRYIEGTVIRFDKDVLARLCYVLECNLEDILHYEEPKK